MMRRKQMESRENFAAAAKIKINDISNLTYANWKALYSAVLGCVDPSDNMLADFNEKRIGTAYIHAQAMREQNPEFFKALTHLAMRQTDFEIRLIDKITFSAEDDADDIARKRALNKPLNRISFEELCNGEYAMRGRVRELMSVLRNAMLHSKTSLSEMDKDKIFEFIGKVEALSQPVDYRARAKTHKTREAVPV